MGDYIASIDAIISTFCNRQILLSSRQFARFSVVPSATAIAAAHRKAVIRIIMKHALWSGNGGGLALLTGSFRRAARRYRPTKTKDAADFIVIFQRYALVGCRDYALTESNVRPWPVPTLALASWTW